MNVCGNNRERENGQFGIKELQRIFVIFIDVIFLEIVFYNYLGE